MQNISGTHLRTTSAARVSARALARVLAAAFLLVAALVAAACLPGVAEAKSYTMPKVDIQAQVETDGSLHVVEQRSFDFSGSFTAVWWDVGSGLPANASIKINGVRMGQLDSSGAISGEWTALASTPFVLSWRDSGGPGTTTYSFDEPKNTVYAFFDQTDTRAMIELDYTVVNGAQAYGDVGEVYWKYVGSQWAEASDNVTMTLSLPVPQGTEVKPGDTVRAWGHGPLDGSVAVGADGSVLYKVARVASGQFAEARVVFPVAWMTNLSKESAMAHGGTLRLDTVLKEEQTWSDQANTQRVMSIALIAISAAVCILLLIWGLWSYMRFGREHTPDFKDEYWRDVPDASVHPAVIGRLWRWDRESSNDFSATLMHLAHGGAVRIDAGSYDETGVFGFAKETADYYITKLPAAKGVTDPIDRAALELLFDHIAEGEDSLWFGSIKKYGQDHPQEFMDAMQSWQGVVSAATNVQDFFELKGKHHQMYLVVMAALLVLGGVVAWVLLQNFIPLICAVPVAIALGVIANHMPRRSVRGNDLVAKCKALRNWLRDFSKLDERPPTDVVVWGEFMVYAYLFGVADQAIKQLKTTLPQLFEYDGSLGMTYMPWWFWYTGGRTAGGTMMPAVGDMFQNSMANTMSSAQEALSSFADGGFSSGSGFGGGFSGGGGGGFGGGGGAR